MGQAKSQAVAPEKAPPAQTAERGANGREISLAPAPAFGSQAFATRDRESGDAGRARSVATLQRGLGNARLSRLLSRAATGPGRDDLAVSPPDSSSEREAESVARQVVAGKPAPPISPMSAAHAGTLRRREREDDETKAPAAPVNRQAAGGGAAAPAGPGTPASPEGPGAPASGDSVARAVDGRGPGSPVDPAVRSTLQPRMGADLGQARVHRDSAANEAAGALNARAFTHGRDVYMGRGESERDPALMAHELTHVVQNTNAAGPAGAPQRLPLLHRAPAPAPAAGLAPGAASAPPPTAPTPAAPEGEVAPGVVELQGKPGFEPVGETAAFFADPKRKKGVVNVRFGSLAEGPVAVKRDGDDLEITRSAIPLRGHPLFAGLQEHAPDLAPALIVSGGKASVTGYVGPAAGKKVATSPGELAAIFAKAPGLMGLTGFDFTKLQKITNSVEAGSLKLGVEDVGVTLGGAFSGTVSLLALDGKVSTFKAAVSIEGQGMAKTDLALERTEAGIITGKVMVAVAHKQVSGSVDVAWDGRALTGTGKVGYSGEKFSGEVTIFLMEKTKAEELEQQKQAPPEEAKGPVAVAPAGKAPAKGRAKPEDYVVFGEGDLTFAFNEWLNGTAHVIIDHKGDLTVIGKITPQAEFILFKQQDYDKELFKAEMRATYGVPVVGNLFIFGNVSLGAFAKIGPGKLYKIAVDGTYSTDPKKAQSFSIQCSLNVSAAAGLRVRGEAGAGIEILSHDLKAGAGINALAGIRGYAEATPVIGYREQAAEGGADKKGEFFIKGDLEIAAQPFLGLSGDLFVEVDAPWWSPVPDKKWTWPIGQKEWPIGGSFGVVASVEHILGSGQWPSIEFKPVEFSADKFLTDLYSDKAPAKSGEKGEQPGTWKEKNEKAAEPPEKGAAKGVPPGKGAAAPPAKSEAAPKGTKQPGKAADPNARTAEGKSVKELQDEASKKGKKPEGAEAGKGAGKDEGAKKDAGKAEHDKLVADDLKKVDQMTKRFEKDGTSKEDLEAALKGIRPTFKAIKSITIVDGKEDWDFDYVASPGQSADGPKKKKADDPVTQAFIDGQLTRQEFVEQIVDKALESLIDTQVTTAGQPIAIKRELGVAFAEELAESIRKSVTNNRFAVVEETTLRTTQAFTKTGKPRRATAQTPSGKARGRRFDISIIDTQTNEVVGTIEAKLTEAAIHPLQEQVEVAILGTGTGVVVVEGQTVSIPSLVGRFTVTKTGVIKV